MVTPNEIVAGLESLGVTHAVWIPDSYLGTWEQAITQSRIELVRVAREGEAFALAAGLMIGDAKPVVIVQCTGFFEAGDAVRNVIHDLKLPLKMFIGVRSRRAVLAGQSSDNCANLTEPVVSAWQIPYVWVDPHTIRPLELVTTLSNWWSCPTPSAILWVE